MTWCSFSSFNQPTTPGTFLGVFVCPIRRPFPAFKHSIKCWNATLQTLPTSEPRTSRMSMHVGRRNPWTLPHLLLSPSSAPLGVCLCVFVYGWALVFVSTKKIWARKLQNGFSYDWSFVWSSLCDVTIITRTYFSLLLDLVACMSGYNICFSPVATTAALSM